MSTSNSIGVAREALLSSRIFFGLLQFLRRNPRNKHGKCLRELNLSAPSIPPTGVTPAPALNRRAGGAI